MRKDCWFVCYEQCSLAGGTVKRSVVLKACHPFEFLNVLEERHNGNGKVDRRGSRVIHTLISFRPISEDEYALAESAGLA